MMKKALLLITLLGFSLTGHAETADSTSIANVKYEIKTTPYLLAQGTLNSNNPPIVPINVEATTLRCDIESTPKLVTSLVSTYENEFYATGGIVNSLTLTANYELSGPLYMSNRGAVGENNYSPITVNWQIWCHPTNTV
jgi:hypothetical protein